MEAGLTQEDLADKLDISLSHLSRIENSNTVIKLDFILRFAEAVHISPARLFEDTPNPN